MDHGNRIRHVMALVVLASALSIGPGTLPVEAAEELLRIPDYAGWRLEEEATTYRPGTDLRFYALELRSFANPQDPAEKVVELRRHDALYILYHYTFSHDSGRWAIYMDAGFADAPCGFLDPPGKATGRYVRIDLACLRDTERIDRRAQ
ncbi:MAG: hypothetical protein ACREI5_08375 [Candidatus Methylomirabilales bacterium]